MKRRDLLVAASGLGLTGSDVLQSAAKTRTDSSRPARNILLIIADDQGYDLSCCGGRVKTPVLDDLAAQGTLFTRGFATVSSCSSSRATLYTGLYSHTNGMYGLAHDVHNFSLLDDIKTLPWMLQQSGYRTALVGKKHVKPDALLPYDAWLAPELPGIRDVAAMAHLAGQWIRGQDKNRPFFLTVGYSDPHRDAAPLPGRSLLPILEQTDSVGFDRIFATHSFHEINQYYPMRSVRTRRYSYFLNLEPSRDVPVAGDVQLSPSWKAITNTPGAKLGKRTLDAFTHRPSEELYDLDVDPDEIVNLAADASHATVMADLRKQVHDWRAATHDPWLAGITDPFGHAH